MPLEAGRLDRVIQIQRPTKTKTAMGGETIAWTLFKEVYAEKVPVRASERFLAGQIQASKVEQFRIRYLPGLVSSMRIKFADQYYRILGIDEFERGVSMEIIAEFLESGSGA